MKSRSNGSNVIILGKPLMKKSWKVQLQEKMDKIGNFYQDPISDHKKQEQIQDYSREPYYD